MSVERFRGEYFFLSNTYPLTNWIMSECGIAVPTSEHDYHVARFTDFEAQQKVALARDEEHGRHGIASKKLAYELLEAGAEQRPDWEIVKPGVMLVSLTKKFTANPDLAELLVATGDHELVEGNTWGDRDWGVDPIGSRNGKNWLGRLLMFVREDFRSGKNWGEI